VIWVEILNRRHEVTFRHRHDGPSLLIGRAYDNDVVVDDPYVAPAHLRVFRDDDGRLVAENRGSANGLFVAGSAKRSDRVSIDGDRMLRIGQTLLRVRDASHPVAPERPLAASPGGWRLAALLFPALLAVLGLLQWLRETDEIRSANLFMQGLGVTAGVLAWVAVWSLLSRLLAGHSRFELHLSIALASLLATVLILTGLDVGAYALSARILSDGTYVVGWLCVAAICYAHLRALGPTHRVLKAGVPLGLALLAIAGQTVGDRESRHRIGDRPYLRNYAPPDLRIARQLPVAEFLAGAEGLQATLDRERREKPSADHFPGLDLE
jgi:pSer/pThr/pTyr-binding forkhead associated (FHA) protein